MKKIILIGMLVLITLVSGCVQQEAEIEAESFQTENALPIAPTPPTEEGEEEEEADLVVRVGENGTYSSIQEAIDSASDGSIIQVAQGTYFENINITSPKMFTLQGGWNQDFTSRSEDNSLTVIDGGGNGNVFYIHTELGKKLMLTIEDFTIQNGEAEESGGMFILSEGSIDLALVNNMISENTAEYKGGGGISIWSKSAGSIDATLTNNNISGNTALNNGGGVCILGGGFVNATLINNTISRNTVEEEGGGIHVSSGGTTEVTLINNVIADNIVTNPYNKPPSDGGGIAAYASGPGVTTTLKLTNNLITGNEAGWGGGIWAYAYGADDAMVIIEMKNNIITGNRAGNSGGAIMFGSGQTDSLGISAPGGSVICNLTNNIITRNTASMGDGGVHLHSGSTYGEGGLISLTLQNDILWGNTDPYRGPQLLVIVEGGGSGVATVKASYSDIGSIRTSGGGTYTSDHVINTYPRFMDPANQVFLLQDDSPCVDAGDPSSAYNDSCRPPARGTKRNDIGAYGGPNNCNWP